MGRMGKDGSEHPPAVVFGLPRVLAWRGAVVVAGYVLLVAYMVGLMWLVPKLDMMAVARRPLFAVLMTGGPGVVAGCGLPLWMVRGVRRVMLRPGGCLNCGYATVDETTGVCPECGRLDNREDLNRNWKRHLGARGGGEAGAGVAKWGPPRPVAVTDPVVLARTRRVFWLLGVLTALMYLAVWVLFHLSAGVGARSGVACAFFVVIRGVEWWRVRSYGLAGGTRGVLPHPLSFYEILWMVLPGAGVFLAICAHPMFPGAAYAALVGGPLVLAGMAALGCGLFGSRPGEPVCPGCDYPLAGLVLPGRCPECATVINACDDGGAERVPERRPGMAFLGVGLCVLGGLFIGIMLMSPAAVYRLLPGPVHRRLAATERTAFAALDLDSLSDAERVRLAERVLDARRRHDRWAMTDRSDWLSAEIAAGRMPPEVVERFVMEGFELRILSRGDPRVAVQLSLAGDPPLVDPNSLTLLYFFSGFEIDGGEPVARDGRARDTFNLSAGWAARDAHAERAGTNTGPGAGYAGLTFVPGPGPVRVRARIVTALYAGPKNPTITWHADGSWTIEPEPLHTAEFVAETRVGADG